ncbi:2-amino-4-hydroxy-6-hydroxymethyldihydropteridine diphosphokinase [Camelimonas fluminis]|uniref:2-amino-4-hydroxy-6-hydroxymethyldihydropteridine pyrophosphokinase n=1 Tax=Camelimonas fluminis TaxID=1576911 RepID=A0ABV7UHX9_9HYPH|nr:2-amino-4-hydroxy-6-hydroxymethyldihydropteridine diphosphokinase [Camelimonas fluminis]GHE62858.1 2-amino-4-hydroxy-6-hydroxymethyldihydropteridine diphosphokinase [Camelimonas fluminis]
MIQGDIPQGDMAPEGGRAAPADVVFTRAFLGLGGNLGDVAARFDAAIALLAAAEGVEMRRRSALWRTPPWGDPDQPPFLNACVEIGATLPPLALLRLCLDVERRLGRDRQAPDARRWGPRPIDIDLLDMANVALDTPELTLPHPRLGERAFALAPLVELAPDLPVSVRDGGLVVQMPARQALARLSMQGLERLED